MVNPEVTHEKTPNGGDYSEFYLLDKDGNLANDESNAVSFRILEKKDRGEIVQTTYGLI